MEKIIIIFYIISSLFNYIFTEENLKGVYSINPIQKSTKFITNFSKIPFNNFKIFISLFDYNVRIIPIDNDKYNIQTLFNNKILTVDNYNNVTFNDNYMDNIYWNFIKINDKEYLIQNIKTQNFLELYSFSLNCSKDITDIVKNDYKNIPDNFKFNIIKLYEEAETNQENIKYIDDEPIDVIIKYIDISYEKLNKEEIYQFSEDEEHDEIKYSLRSVFNNIPWFRKIFIAMPSEKIKYFKTANDLEGRIVYIKDEDIIGFNSTNDLNFLLCLWNLEKFNVSKNIILMNNNNFIDKPIKKSDFFYYDGEQNKVLPNIVSDEFKILNKEKIYEEYNNLFSKKDIINPHTKEGLQLHSLASLKLLFDNYPEPLIDAGFTHNAISLNIYDVKEIYNLVKEKYQYANEILISKEKIIYDIQFETLYNAYAINILKRKVHSLQSKFLDLNQLNKNAISDIELFALNISRDNKYNINHFKNLKQVLESKFNNPTPFEMLENKNKFSYIINNISQLFKKNKNLLFGFLLISIILIIINTILELINKNNNPGNKRDSYKKKQKIYRAEENQNLNII